MSSIKISLLSICLVFFLSCKQESPEEILRSTIQNITTLNSCEYKIKNTFYDNSSIEYYELFARNQNDTSLFDVIIQDSIRNPLSATFDNEHYGIAHVKSSLHKTSEILSDIINNKIEGVDSINISNNKDTIIVIYGSKEHDAYARYKIKVKNYLPVYISIAVKYPQLAYLEDNYTTLEYINTNDVKPEKIAELKSFILDQNEKMKANALASALNFENNYLKGSIGGISIRMNMKKGTGKSLTGSYYYTHKGIPIELSGELSDDGTFTLNEEVDNKKTGVFTGQFISSYEVSGTWSNPSGNKTLDFNLINNYKPADIEWIKDEKVAQNKASLSFNLPRLSMYNDDIANKINNIIGSNPQSVNNFMNTELEDGWFIEKEASVYLNSNDILSLTISEFTFMGGAHPNAETVSRNFDLSTGQILSLNDLFIAQYEEKLNKLAIDKFRKICNEENEQEAWLDWEVERIPNYLKTNFIIDIKGISFFFNRYDIGPYVAGNPPNILLTYNELEEIINHQGILSQMLD